MPYRFPPTLLVPVSRYGGVVEREAVVAGADWFVNDWADLEKALKRYKVKAVALRNPMPAAFAATPELVLAKQTGQPC